MPVPSGCRLYSATDKRPHLDEFGQRRMVSNFLGQEGNSRARSIALRVSGYCQARCKMMADDLIAVSFWVYRPWWIGSSTEAGRSLL